MVGEQQLKSGICFNRSAEVNKTCSKNSSIAEPSRCLSRVTSSSGDSPKVRTKRRWKWNCDRQWVDWIAGDNASGEVLGAYDGDIVHAEESVQAAMPAAVACPYYQYAVWKQISEGGQS